MIFQIMIVEFITALIEQALIVRNNHYELVSLHTIIQDAVLIFAFDRESMFAMHLSSNHTFTNTGRVAYILMVLVPELHWTRNNLPRLLWMFFTGYLFITIFTVDWLSSSSNYGLTASPGPWVSFYLFRNECL